MVSLGRLLLIGLLVSMVAIGAAGESAPTPIPERESQVTAPTFDTLLLESGMRFEAPDGFAPVEIHPNPSFRYDHAIGAADGSLEVRYAVRPLKRIVVDYQDPHSSAPDPNHMFSLMFQSLVTLLSNGRHSPTGEYSLEQARDKFRADWAAASVFDVSAEFSADHGQALLIAMHRNGLADAYAVFLFDDYGEARKRIDRSLGALAFVP